MSPRERPGGGCGGVIGGCEQHYTISCKGTVSSTLDSTFTFADGIIRHTILYEWSLRQQPPQSLAVRCAIDACVDFTGADMAGLGNDPVQVFRTLPDLHWEFCVFGPVFAS
jgi:hypothetical protein